MLNDICPQTQRSPISGDEPTDYIPPDIRIKWRRARWNGMLLGAGFVTAVGMYLWNV